MPRHLSRCITCILSQQWQVLRILDVLLWSQPKQNRRHHRERQIFLLTRFLSVLLWHVIHFFFLATLSDSSCLLRGLLFLEEFHVSGQTQVMQCTPIKFQWKRKAWLWELATFYSHLRARTFESGICEDIPVPVSQRWFARAKEESSHGNRDTGPWGLGKLQYNLKQDPRFLMFQKKTTIRLYF